MATNKYPRPQSEFRKVSQVLADEIEPTAAEVARWAEDYATLNDAMNGSSKLTAQQTAEVEEKLGDRYVRIQETPQYASRKERRRRRFRPRSERR